MGHLDLGIDARLGFGAWGLEVVLKHQGASIKSQTSSNASTGNDSKLGVDPRIVFLRKTGEVMRFCDHGGAAGFYKRGICRGIWDEDSFGLGRGMGWSFDQIGAARDGESKHTEY